MGDIDQLVSLWRNKRSAESTTGILQPDEDDFMEFLDDVDDFKEGMATKLGNLTCVMTEMKMLTPELKVNIEEYTKDMEEEEEIDLNETPIIADPELRKRLTTGYQDCYDIAESIPSQALSKSPLSRVFGRQMIFFKCAKKNEKLNCAMGQMKRLVEEWYGSGETLPTLTMVSQRMNMRQLLLVSWFCAMGPLRRRDSLVISFGGDTCKL